MVDLLAILPTYLSLLLPASRSYLLVIRILRVLRIFRVLKLVQYLDEAQVLMRALRSGGRKIVVFFLTVMALVVVFGSLMYLIEGEENGFDSIPRSIYWAIVTMTTERRSLLGLPQCAPWVTTPTRNTARFAGRGSEPRLPVGTRPSTRASKETTSLTGCRSTASTPKNHPSSTRLK